MRREKEGNVLRLVVEKDLIAPNVKDLNVEAMRVVEGDADTEEVILDIGAVKNIDSMGVTFVITFYKNLLREGKVFSIANASQDIKQLFKLMKLESFVSFL
jgi:anti-anti-sigma factor